MGARCSACGGSVMPYRSYVLHSPPTALCSSCGARVRIRGWRGLVGAGMVILAGLFVTVLLSASLGTFLLVAVALAFLGLAMDYAGYRLLPWDPVAGAGRPTARPPGAARA